MVHCYRISKNLYSSLGTWASGNAFIIAADLQFWSWVRDEGVQAAGGFHRFNVAFEPGWVPDAEK